MARILLKNGRVWDGDGFFFADVLTDGKRISKIAPDIQENDAYVYDASGKIVSAGLVDAHVHFKGISGDEFCINGEAVSFPFGVTAAADASADCGKPDVFDGIGVKMALFVSVPIKSNTAVLAGAERLLSIYGDRVVGLKVYLDSFVSEVWDITPLSEIVAFAEQNHLIVMVHSSNSPVSMKMLLGALRRGDILTHAYHGGKNNVSDDHYECIADAKARGVIIDVGFAGNVHADFSILAEAIKCGCPPDVISTDITRYSAFKRGGRYGMTLCMSIARHLGMQEADIFKAVTSTPARALRQPWGTLKVGGCADIAVLAYDNEGFELTDKAGNRVESTQGYRCTFTVSDGEVVYST